MKKTFKTKTRKVMNAEPIHDACLPVDTEMKVVNEQDTKAYDQRAKRYLLHQRIKNILAFIAFQPIGLLTILLIVSTFIVIYPASRVFYYVGIALTWLAGSISRAGIFTVDALYNTATKFRKGN
jgi:hypothetical protein